MKPDSEDITAPAERILASVERIMRAIGIELAVELLEREAERAEAVANGSMPCHVCGADTDRGTLIRVSGDWTLVPLCQDHKDAVAKANPNVPTIDMSRPN